VYDHTVPRISSSRPLFLFLYLFRFRSSLYCSRRLSEGSGRTFQNYSSDSKEPPQNLPAESIATCPLESIATCPYPVTRMSAKGDT
jgi:hypothetical protein